MIEAVQGNDVLLRLHDGDSYKDFACAKDFSVNFTTSYVETTTVGDGMWPRYSPQVHGYTMTLTGVIVFDDVKWTSFDIVKRQIDGLEFKYQAIFTQGAKMQILYGHIFIENSVLNGNVNSVAGSEHSFIGNGAPVFTGCIVIINSVDVEVTGTTIDVTINADGDPAYFIYQVDSGFEQQSLTPTFTVNDIPGGFHRLTVIPVCTGEVRGIESITDFYVEVDLPVTACPNVTGLNITEVTQSSFEAFWTIPAGASSVDVYLTNISTQNEIPYLNLATTSKLFDNLTPGTGYRVRIVTNCNDNTQSGGIVAQTATLSAPTSIRGTIYNNHPDVVLETFELSYGYDVEYGAIPVLGNQSTGLINLTYGPNDLIISMSNNGGPATVTVTTEFGSETATGQNNFLVNIGNGGLTISIDPA